MHGETLDPSRGQIDYHGCTLPLCWNLFERVYGYRRLTDEKGSVLYERPVHRNGAQRFLKQFVKRNFHFGIPVSCLHAFTVGTLLICSDLYVWLLVYRY